MKHARWRRCRGLTLFELIVAISIILVLAVLLYPAFAQARIKATEAPCTSNLRQLLVAAQLYREDHDGQLPTQTFSTNRWTEPYLKARAVLTCPLDAAGRGNVNATRTDGYPSSYATWFDDRGWRDELVNADPNPALFVCFQHGQHDGSPVRNHQAFTGAVLRARLDGSVQRADVPHQCFQDGTGGSYGGRIYWSLFTSAIPTPARLDEEVGASGVRVVPCVAP